MQSKILLLHLIGVFCYDYDGFDVDIVVGNLKRRNFIPLHRISEKYLNDETNLNYRKTKGIEAEILDRKIGSEHKVERDLTNTANMDRMDTWQRQLRSLTHHNRQDIDVELL